jgi:hypothetical protein
MVTFQRFGNATFIAEICSFRECADWRSKRRAIENGAFFGKFNF